MSTSMRNWHYNRPGSRKSRLQRWITNPLGAFVRILEFGYFGIPLISLLKSVSHFDEISWMNKDLSISESSKALLLKANFMHLPTLLIRSGSGHILFIRQNYQSFMSGMNYISLRKLKKAHRGKSFTNVIPLGGEQYYFHFVCETLPALLKTFDEFKSASILTPTNQPEFVFEYLKLFNFKVIITKEEIVHLSDSYVPTVLRNHDLVKFRDILLDKANIQNANQQRKLLLLRKGLDRDDADLSLFLEELLLPLGFELFESSNYSVLEQIQIFADASEIVAVHGGALTNIIACKPNTKILEIFSHVYRNGDFREIARNLNFDYLGIDSNDRDSILKWSRSS